MKSVVKMATALSGAALGCAAAVMMSAPAQAATTVTVGFQNDNFGGSSITFSATPNGFQCSSSRASRELGWSNFGLSAPGWNDQITSFRTYTGCAARFWENAGYTGASFGYAGTTGNIGRAMNDRATALEVS